MVIQMSCSFQDLLLPIINSILSREALSMFIKPQVAAWVEWRVSDQCELIIGSCRVNHVIFDKVGGLNFCSGGSFIFSNVVEMINTLLNRVIFPIWATEETYNSLPLSTDRIVRIIFPQRTMDSSIRVDFWTTAFNCIVKYFGISISSTKMNCSFLFDEHFLKSASMRIAYSTTTLPVTSSRLRKC